MAHSIVRNTLHCIFAVKNRLPLLHPEIRPLLFERTRSIIDHHYPRCGLIAINGVVDHVHALIELHQSVELQAVIRDIKARSSQLLNQLNSGPGRFAWQNGYAAFGCEFSGIDRVVSYIERQEEHHCEEDFLDEYIRILRENGIDYYQLRADDRLV